MPPVRLAPFIGAMSLIGACTLGRGGDGQNVGQTTTRNLPGAIDSGTADPTGGAAAESIPPRQLRRLSNREYNNVVHDLLGDDSRPADVFIEDVYQNGFDNGAVSLAVQSDQVFAYQKAAEALAGEAVASAMDRLLGGCDVGSEGEAACENAFLASFAPRAYRRPLTTNENRRLRDMFDAGAAVGGFALGIQTALELILQSPQFLYREELGLDVIPISGRQVGLTPYEVASELSFLLTGSIADDDLWNAVREGRFTTADDRRREALRLLATDGARATLRGFLHQWLGTAHLTDMSKDPAFYPTFDAAMAASMKSELDRFYEASLFSGDASLRALFTSNASFVDATMANLYGTTISGDGFQPALLDPNLRKGVLSRAGFLAAHAAADSSGPISRGVFVLEAILCSPPPPPPPDVPRAMPAGDPAAQIETTRQRFAEHVENPRCAGCHGIIDGIGFGFEEFDGIGAFRATENGLPVDSGGTILGTGEIDGTYQGVGELATRLSGSQRLVDCYLRQAYRYAMGQVEPQGSTDTLGWMRRNFSSDAQLVDALMTIVSDPRFAARRFE